MRQLVPLVLAVCLASTSFVACAAQEKVPPAAEYFPDDSRRLSQVSKAVVLTDFSKAEPASALITGKREKGKWKLIPFTTAEMKGTALSIYSAGLYIGGGLSLPVGGLVSSRWNAAFPIRPRRRSAW